MNARKKARNYSIKFGIEVSRNYAGMYDRNVAREPVKKVCMEKSKELGKRCTEE